MMRRKDVKRLFIFEPAIVSYTRSEEIRSSPILGKRDIHHDVRI